MLLLQGQTTEFPFFKKKKTKKITSKCQLLIDSIKA